MKHIVVTLVMILLLTGCGGISAHNSVKIDSFLSGESINVNLSSRYVYHPNIEKRKIKMNRNINEAYEILQNQNSSDSSINVEKFSHGSYPMSILLTKDHANKTQDFVILHEVIDDWWFLSNLNTMFTIDDETYFSFLTPLHLTNDMRLFDNFSRIYENAEYQTPCGINEFYANSGWYDVKIENERIIFSGYNVTPAEPRINSEVIDEQRQRELDIPFPIEISFSEHAVQNFFKVYRR